MFRPGRQKNTTHLHPSEIEVIGPLDLTVKRQLALQRIGGGDSDAERPQTELVDRAARVNTVRQV